MERTVPSTVSEEIELYLRTYYSLLRTTTEVQIRTLEEAHARMKSLLHPGAPDAAPDMSAFIYSLLRLPACLPRVQLVVLGQSPIVFERGGYGDVESWQPVFAQARRRRCYFDGHSLLACFIASRSDIDDVIPMLTAYQIEWNKLHLLLRQAGGWLNLQDLGGTDEHNDNLADALQISPLDLAQLRVVWGNGFYTNLAQVAAHPCRLRVQLLSGSLSEYWRATRLWWQNIQEHCPALLERPVYFVSSNPHSLLNLISGFALHHQDELIDFLHQPENADLQSEWQMIQADEVPSSRENFLYYLLKRYQNTSQGYPLDEASRALEPADGIRRIPSEHSFDVEGQVFELSRLRPEAFDPRLDGDLTFLRHSQALILNIDYPLGLAAYNILSKVAEFAGRVLGVYVSGKSATLNGVMGDVMIPNVVHDEQSRNTYLFPNCFCAADVAPFLTYGTVLDNQKAVSVRGTFLQNKTYMDVFYREGYTDIEMEAGPYLSAVYEMYRPQRHPVNEIANLYGLPFDIGILHYASDTPMSKGGNLGAGSLSYFGMDSTYAVSLAILRRIFELERQRLRSQTDHAQRSPRG
jgi:hypothetical protein